MSQIHVTVRLALLALAIAASTADAQQRGEGAIVETCRAEAGGSRARRNCEPQPAAVPTQRETQLASEPVPLPSGRQCEAGATMEYSQRNTSARVASTISVATCPAATGTFTIVLRIKDESGEIKPVAFNETWQRADAQNVSFAADYPIGENVELVSARVRTLRCTCADAPQEPAKN
jgi:hypothetical protein